MEEVILVNKQDEPIGTMEKILAHEQSRLHRAFSIFIFNDNGDMLIHQRADEKYHSGGLWTNACCSHPRPGEMTADGAIRRLSEELNIQCPVKEVYSFIYKAELDHDLTEHEFDHVFFGKYSGDLHPNQNEVMDWKYVPISDLLQDIKSSPDNYTEWFKIALEGLKKANINLTEI